MELQTSLKPLAAIDQFGKFPVLGSLFNRLEEEGELGARPCANGVEVRFLNDVQGIPNRGYLRIYFPLESKCVLFFHKKSAVPFSHDRYSYGGVVIDARSSQRFSEEQVQDWVRFLKSGLQPQLRPTTLKKSIPFTIPEDSDN